LSRRRRETRFHWRRAGVGMSIGLFQNIALGPCWANCHAHSLVYHVSLNAYALDCSNYLCLCVRFLAKRDMLCKSLGKKCVTSPLYTYLLLVMSRIDITFYLTRTDLPTSSCCRAYSRDLNTPLGVPACIGENCIHLQ
jgi:hypothetical protein